VLTDSEMPMLLVAKLTYFFVSLPEQLILLRDKNHVGMIPNFSEENYLESTNLLDQVEQSCSKEMVKAHIEFVKFCAFLNMCADTV